MRPALRASLGGVASAGLAVSAYAIAVEPRWYALRRHTVPGVLRRPGARLRVLHVSDLHLVPGQRHQVRFLDQLARLDYDLVVATGDLLGAVEAEDATVSAMAPLTAGGRPGLVVLGSNDRYGPVPKSPTTYFTRPRRRTHGTPLDTARLVEGLARHGFTTLDADEGHRRTARVDTPAGEVAAAGIDDPHLEETVLPPAAALEVDAPDALLRLGLVHAPYVTALDRLRAAGCDLLVSGHTHGGQVRLPGVGALVNNCDLPLSRSRGLSEWDGGWLHVSAGLGHSRYAPIRLACRPEASLLELTG